jgi:hypothetical protein
MMVEGESVSLMFESSNQSDQSIILLPRSSVPLYPVIDTQSLLHLWIILSITFPMSVLSLGQSVSWVGISQPFYTPHESLTQSLFSQITMMAVPPTAWHVYYVYASHNFRSTNLKSLNLFTFIRHLQLISGPYCAPLLVLLFSLPCISLLRCLVVGSQFRVDTCPGSSPEPV